MLRFEMFYFIRFFFLIRNTNFLRGQIWVFLNTKLRIYTYFEKNIIADPIQRLEVFHVTGFFLELDVLVFVFFGVADHESAFRFEKTKQRGQSDDFKQFTLPDFFLNHGRKCIPNSTHNKDVKAAEKKFLGEFEEQTFRL